MRQKRIDRHTIEQALDEIDEDEYTDILRHLIKAKAASIAEPDTYEGRTKLYRFGASRGFEPALVARILRESN